MSCNAERNVLPHFVAMWDQQAWLPQKDMLFSKPSDPEAEAGSAPEETHLRPEVRPTPEDPLSMSLGAQIDLLELQMNAIAQQNAELEQHLLPAHHLRSEHLRFVVETDVPEQRIDECEHRRRLERECQKLREQLAKSKQEVTGHSRILKVADQQPVNYFNRNPRLQSLSEQICLQLAHAEQEVRQQALMEVQEAERREQQLKDECWELRVQLANASKQLQCKELQLQMTARSSDIPAGVSPSAQADLVQELRAECIAEKQNAARWRRMVLEEQERNNELQERLLEASKAEREARRAEREARKGATRALPTECVLLNKHNSM